MRQEGIIYSSVSWNSFKTFWLSSVFRHGMCLVDFLSLFLFLSPPFFFFFTGGAEGLSSDSSRVRAHTQWWTQSGLHFLLRSETFPTWRWLMSLFPPKHPCWGWKVIRRWCVTKKPHYIIWPDMTDDSRGSVLLSLRIISTLKKKEWKDPTFCVVRRQKNLAGIYWETGVLQS